MKLGKMGHALAQSSSTYRQMQFFGCVALWILGWHAISVNVFTRKDFGCRYLSKLNILFGLTAIGIYSGLGNLAISAASRQPFSGLMELFYTCFLGLGIYHGVQVWLSRKRVGMPHTMYSGRPLLAVTGLDEGVIKRWIEPAMLLSLGYIAAHTHQNAVAVWLYIGAVSVFVHETLGEYMEEAKILDGYDAMIEANTKSGIMSGRHTKDMGFSISQGAQTLMRQHPEIVPEYSDEVQGMLDREVVR
jgi:hypothetical protein